MIHPDRRHRLTARARIERLLDPGSFNELDLLVTHEELERRRQAFVPPRPHYDRGYGKLFLDHVTQANHGCDFDFLRKTG